jgi:hypothetical protein
MRKPVRPQIVRLRLQRDLHHMLPRSALFRKQHHLRPSHRLSSLIHYRSGDHRLPVQSKHHVPRIQPRTHRHRRRISRVLLVTFLHITRGACSNGVLARLQPLKHESSFFIGLHGQIRRPFFNR